MKEKERLKKNNLYKTENIYSASCHNFYEWFLKHLHAALYIQCQFKAVMPQKGQKHFKNAFEVVHL